MGSDGMDGYEILNKFKKGTFYEFSEAIPIFNDEIYLIFKVEVISIESNPSEIKDNGLRKLIRRIKIQSEPILSHLEIEPIAYLLKDIGNEYTIEAIDAAFCKALLVTFVGSTIPAFFISTYCSVAASNPIPASDCFT